MYIQINAQPEHDFHDPIGLLGDCHRRIEAFLALFLKVARDAPEAGLPDAYETALRRAVTYFREAAPKHTQDEEESLFPVLGARLGEEALQGHVAHLQAEHELADELHSRVDLLAERWLSSGQISVEDRATLLGMLERLEGLYEHHIRYEDEVLFPLAARELDADQLERIGVEMAGRRGL
jgi:hemerythrin-like domain-containing protein